MTAFEELYRTYFNDVYLYIRKLSGDEHIAQEITSDTFFKAMHAMDRFRGDCDVRVWLCQIAKNCYATYMQKRGRTVFPDEQEWERFPDGQPDPAERLADREEAAHIQKILHGIPEPYKEVFLLRTLGQLSFKQIGALFGKTENWACVTYHRARTKLQQERWN